MVQRAPPSSVRSTVPLLPLAHATFSLTALTARSRSDVPLVCNCQVPAAAAAAATTVMTPVASASAPCLSPEP